MGRGGRCWEGAFANARVVLVVNSDGYESPLPGAAQTMCIRVQQCTGSAGRLVKTTTWGAKCQLCTFHSLTGCWLGARGCEQRAWQLEPNSLKILTVKDPIAVQVNSLALQHFTTISSAFGESLWQQATLHCSRLGGISPHPPRVLSLWDAWEGRAAPGYKHKALLTQSLTMKLVRTRLRDAVLLFTRTYAVGTMLRAPTLCTVLRVHCILYGV
jgi:hypothetical protein